MGKHNKRHSIPTSFVGGLAIRQLHETLYMVDFMRNGKRTRKSFPSMDDAKAFAQGKALELKNQGTAAMSISERQRNEVVEVLRRLGGRITLSALADYWLKRHPDTSAQRWNETAEMYIAEMTKAKRRKASLSDKAIKLKILSDGLGNPPTCAVDKATLESAVRVLAEQRAWSNNTCDMYVNAGLTLVRYATGENKRMRTIDEKPPETWSADFIADLLHKAEEVAPAIVPALAIQVFSGIRPNEIVRLTWASVNLASNTISLEGATTKTRTTRHVNITPNLLAWLTAYRGEGGIVSSFMTYRRGRDKLKVALKITEWPNDVLRHTAATMIYARTKNADETCSELGHFDTDTFLRHYKGLAPTPDNVVKFWQIVPSVKKG